MSKKTFNPADWTPIEPQRATAQPIQSIQNPALRGVEEVETITRRIEAASIDIAPNYADWRDLGFALADALGESGRQYYHRLSRFYPDYSSTETDKQFDNCLKAHGHGITIKTLFHLAKQAGIEISNLQIAKLPKWRFGNFGKIGTNHFTKF